MNENVFITGTSGRLRQQRGFIIRCLMKIKVCCLYNRYIF